MTFRFSLSDELRFVLEKIRRRDPALAKAVSNKITQIAEQNDEVTIDHFKNLRHDLSDFKRVHVGNFILMFRVFKKENFILFERLRHHDDAY